MPHINCPSHGCVTGCYYRCTKSNSLLLNLTLLPRFQHRFPLNQFILNQRVCIKCVNYVNNYKANVTTATPTPPPPPPSPTPTPTTTATNTATTSSSSSSPRVYFSSLQTLTYKLIMCELRKNGCCIHYEKGPDPPASLLDYHYVIIGHDWIDYISGYTGTDKDYTEWMRRWTNVIDAAGLRSRVYPRLEHIQYIVSKRYQLELLNAGLMDESTYLITPLPVSHSTTSEWDRYQLSTAIDFIAARARDSSRYLHIHVKSGYSCASSSKVHMNWNSEVKDYSAANLLSKQVREKVKIELSSFIGKAFNRGVSHVCLQEELKFYSLSEVRLLVNRDRFLLSPSVSISKIDELHIILSRVVSVIWQNDPPLYWRLDVVRDEQRGKWFVGEVEMCGAEYVLQRGEQEDLYIEMISRLLDSEIKKQL